MALRIAIVFCIVMLGLKLWWTYGPGIQETKRTDHQKNWNQKVETVSEKKEVKPTTGTRVSEDPRASQKFIDLLAEVETGQYSNDPYLEAFAIHNRLSKCHLVNMEYSKSSLLKAGKAAFVKKKEQCNSLQKQFPLIAQKQWDDGDFNLLPSTTYISGLLKQQPRNETEKIRAKYAANFFEVALKNKNYFLIKKALYHRNHAFEQIVDEQTELIKSSNKGYFKFVVFPVTMHLLACELNQKEFCAADSWQMMLRCEKEQNSCGLTYQEWFNKSFMPGMKKDVLLLLDYYRRKSNE